MRLVYVLALASCSGDPDAGPAKGPAPTCVAVGDAHPNVIRVSWTTDAPGTSHVVFGDATGDRVTPTTAEGTAHEVVVYGLKANHRYTMRGVTETADGTVETAPCEVETGLPPRDLPGFTLTVPADDRTEPGGYVLTSLIGTEATWVVVLDRDGDPVWWSRGEDETAIPTVEPGLDGRSLTWTHAAKNQSEDRGGIVREALDGSVRTLTRAPLVHHDYAELPDGRFAYLRIEFDDPEVPTVALDSIAIVPEGAEEGVEPEIAWSYVDHYRDEQAACWNWEPDAYGTDAFDCTHANSLLYDADADRYYVMSKTLDHILKIDPSTPAVEWELGGRYTDFELAPGWSWSRVHFSDLRDGAACVFDNGYEYEPASSRVTEIVFDEDARTAEQVWSWEPDPIEFVGLLGDCRKLPGGTYLTAWTSTGTLREVDAAGDVVWEAEVDLGNGVGRATWIADLWTLDRP